MRYTSILVLPSLAVAFAAGAVTTGPVPSSGAAYPPSCLSAPLIDEPSGPVVTRASTLASIDLETNEYHGVESVDVTFWRVACEGGKSALLMRIARVPGADLSMAAQYPFDYGISATHGEVPERCASRRSRTP